MFFIIKNRALIFNLDIKPIHKQEVKRERERKKKSQHIAHINRKRVINSKHMFFTFYFNHPFIGTFQPHTFRV